MALSADAARTGATTNRTLNKLAFAIANVADDITTATTSDRVVMVDASADYAVKYADGDNLREMQRSVISITDATTYTALYTNSGKTHIIPDLTASITITLPVASAGVEYTFIGKAIAADAQNWVFAAGVDFIGGLAFADTDAGAGADEIHAGVYPAATNDNMTIVTPGAGTRIYLVCDGTNWIANGQVFSATVPAFSA